MASSRVSATNSSCRGWTCRSTTAASPQSSGRRAAERRRCCASSPASSSQMPGWSGWATGGSSATGARSRRNGAGSVTFLKKVRCFRISTSPPTSPSACRERCEADHASVRCSKSSSFPAASRVDTPTNCRAVSSSGWRSPVPWPPSRRWCCWTSRSRRSMRRCAKGPGAASYAPCELPGQQRCSSRMTRTKRCRWPTRSASCAKDAWRRSVPRLRCTGPPSIRRSPCSSAARRCCLPTSTTAWPGAPWVS